jgi:AcrR family transcriptional regulator
VPPKKLRTTELEQQVLRSALDILQAGAHPLTARTVAAAAGTSTAALYELFGDKAGVIKAVFYEGFRLCAMQAEALPLTGDSHRDVIALLQAKRTFSKTNPMLWQVMFGQPFPEFRPTVDDYKATKDFYVILLAQVDRLLADSGGSADRVDVARVLMGVNRGLIASELDGILGSDKKASDRRWNLAVRALLDGFTQGSVQVRQPKRSDR